MTASGSIVARVSRRLSATPGRIFDARLDPASIRVWMGTALSEFGFAGELRRVEVDARVGGRFTFSDVRPDGEAVHWGTYLVVDRPHRLDFTWFTSEEDERDESSIVTVTIEPDSDGSVVTIPHEMAAAWAEYVGRVEAGWGGMLAAIDLVLTGSRG